MVAKTDKRREEEVVEEEEEEQRGKKTAEVWRRRGEEMERFLGVKRRGEKWRERKIKSITYLLSQNQFVM